MDLNDDIFEELEENTDCEECEITVTNIAPETPAAPENKWALRDRFRSKLLWTALGGVIISVISGWDLWGLIGITEPKFKMVLTALGALLAAFGVFNDPTSRGRF